MGTQQWLKYLPNVVFAVWLSFLGYKAYGYFDALETQKTKLRQMEGLLNEQERKMQEEHLQLDLTKAKLEARAEKLESEAEALRTKYRETTEDFDRFVEEHNLKLRSYQRANYRLRQKIATTKESEPVVTITTSGGSCEEHTEVKYRYEEKHGRVVLETPNCLKKGGEVLTLNQSFVVYGEVYQQEGGALQVSSLTLKEVSPTDSEVVLSTAELKGGEFKYHPLDTAKPSKPFNLIAGVGFDKEGYAYVSFGVSPLKYKSAYLSVAYMLFEQAKPLERHGVSARLGWRPTLLEGDLNVGLSLGVGVPLHLLIPQYTLSIDFFVW